LFYLHQGDAGALANYLDLSAHRAVLDVGGGSGVMSIALVNKNPHLNACILDTAPVCEIAAKNVKRARLSRQIRTLVGDIRHSWPRGFDVVLFCDIGAVSMQHLRNAYRCLPGKGLFVLTDRYLADDGTKTLDRLVEHRIRLLVWAGYTRSHGAGGKVFAAFGRSGPEMLTGTCGSSPVPSQIGIPVRHNGLYPRVAATSGNRLLAPKVLTRGY